MNHPSHIANHNSQILAWHGWSLQIPATWNPVKLDGDHDQGSMLLADLGAARLGIRWRTAGRGDPSKWADRALREELGDAADRATAFAAEPRDAWTIASLCLASDFPARDVFVGWSTRSCRVIELVYNVAERDDVLERDILPTLTDTAADSPHRWSIFGLDLTTPPGHTLQSFALNAGDLSLTFRHQRDQTTIRRISPASLALSRQPIERWLTLSKSNRKIYALRSLPVRGRLGGGGDGQEASPAIDIAAPMISAIAERRRRLFWAWFVPRDLLLLAAHDEPNNRLLLGTSSNGPLLRELMSRSLCDSCDVEKTTETRELAGVA